MVNCPVCDAVIDAEEDELDEGDEFTCDDCGAELTVKGTDPLELGTAADAEDEDEEDDEDDLDLDEEEEDEEDEDEDWK